MANHRITTQILLQEELAKSGGTQKEMASILGISEAYLNEIIHGKKPGTSRLFEFADKLKRNLFEKKEIPAILPRPIPVISWVHAGEFAESEDHWPVGISGEDDPVYCYKKVGLHAFALKVQGNSMSPRYLPGDTIIVDPEIRCDNGGACVVWINGEVSLKLFYEDDNEIRLVPMNESCEIRAIPKSRKVDFRVIGKVVDLIPKL